MAKFSNPRPVGSWAGKFAPIGRQRRLTGAKSDGPDPAAPNRRRARSGRLTSSELAQYRTRHLARFHANALQLSQLVNRYAVRAQLVEGVYRAAVLLVGVFFAYLGYRLYVAGVYGTSDVSAAFGQAKVSLLRAGPGVIFALFGGIMIIVSVWRLAPFPGRGSAPGIEAGTPGLDADQQEALPSRAAMAAYEEEMASYWASVREIVVAMHHEALVSQVMEAAYRGAVLIAGVAFAYLGFLLFLRAVLGASDFAAGFSGLTVSLPGAAPGTLFAVFGAAVICVSIWRLLPLPFDARQSDESSDGKDTDG